MQNYYYISFIDVNDLLSFGKKDFKEFEKLLKEEQRVEKEVKDFILSLEKHTKHKIHYIGHEKRYGKHLIRFMLKEGFLEIIVDKPATINGHFISKKVSEIFAKGLKEVMKEKLPESNIKEMIIDSIQVKDGSNEEIISLDTHSILHKLRVKKTLVMSIVAVELFLIFEVVQESIEYVTLEYIKIPSIFISIIAAIIIALIFEPLKELVEKVLEHVFET